MHDDDTQETVTGRLVSSNELEFLGGGTMATQHGDDWSRAWAIRSPAQPLRIDGEIDHEQWNGFMAVCVPPIAYGRDGGPGRPFVDTPWVQEFAEPNGGYLIIIRQRGGRDV